MYCKRKCNRWPVAVICNMVDVACINASFIFVHSGALSSTVSHLDFLKECGYQLTHACIQRRMTQEKCLQRDVRMAMELCGYTLALRRPTTLDGFLQKPKRCEFCPSSRDRKSKSVCWKCLKVICVEHSCKVCYNCASFWKVHIFTNTCSMCYMNDRINYVIFTWTWRFQFIILILVTNVSYKGPTANASKYIINYKNSRYYMVKSPYIVWML